MLKNYDNLILGSWQNDTTTLFIIFDKHIKKFYNERDYLFLAKGGSGLKINVKTSQSNYDIIIENGSFNNLINYINDLIFGRKIFVVTDDNVDSFYGDRISAMLNAYDFKKIVLPNGETTKSIEYLNKLYSEMATFKMSRSDIVIAFGGGVIGDLTGFASATFLRGIRFIQIPTTLLSQVDSSVGGKVAIDLPEGKNLVGSFYPPCRVIIDPDLLGTLPKRVFNDGMAEVIKYGAIRDGKLFEKLIEGVDACLEDVICTCVNIKKKIVENDEFDTGERMILNFGHTFGHAVEKLCNYTTYTHGEAVAIGMLRITKKSESMGITEAGTSDRLKEVLKKYDLLFDDYVFDSNAAYNVLMLDKKGSKDTINYIMISRIGEVIVKEMPKTDTFLTEE